MASVLDSKVTLDGEEITVRDLKKNASRWRKWCAVCLGEEIAKLDGNAVEGEEKKG